MDRETGNQIIEDRACLSDDYKKESVWPLTKRKIDFKQFHHEKYGIVDLSCFQKINKQIIKHDYVDHGAFLIKSQGRRKLVNHLWQNEYNEPMIKFFKSIK